MTKKREREGRMTERDRENLALEKISKEEVRGNMKRMKNGKAIGPDDILVEVRKCLGEISLDFPTKLYNRTMESDMIRRSVETAYDTNFQEQGWRT